MSPRDRSDDPILDVGDLGWWGILGLFSVVPVVLWLSFEWPWWSVVLMAIALSPIFAILLRVYSRRYEARRPSQQHTDGA